MKKVFAHPDITEVEHCRSILDEAGIACAVRHGDTHEIMPGLPDVAHPPALWVENDADAGRAMELLRDLHAADQGDAPEWKCPQCGETVPGNFGSCWKCETPRPAATP
jgi:hypothetical protein